MAVVTETNIYDNMDATVDEFAADPPPQPARAKWDDMLQRVRANQQVAEQAVAPQEAPGVSTGKAPAPVESDEIRGVPEGMEVEPGLGSPLFLGPINIAKELADELGVTKIVTEAMGFVGRRVGSVGTAVLAAAADPSYAETFLGRAGENLVTAGKAFAKEWTSAWGSGGQDYAREIVEKVYPELDDKSKTAVSFGLSVIADPVNVALIAGPLKTLLTGATKKAIQSGTTMTGKTFVEGTQQVLSNLPKGALTTQKAESALRLAKYADAGSRRAATRLSKMMETDLGPAFVKYEQKLVAAEMRSLGSYDMLAYNKKTGLPIVSATGKPKIIRRPPPKVFLEQAERTTAERAAGSVTRLVKDLNGKIKTRPFEFRESYLDINGPKDVDSLITKYVNEATTMVEKAGAKVTGKKIRRGLDELLGSQQEQLTKELGDNILLKITPQEALGYRVLLRDIGAGIKQCIRDIPVSATPIGETLPFQFSGNQDFLRFWKLVTAREAVRSTLTLRKIAATKAFGRISTVAPKDSPGVRLLMFQRAKDALPKPSSGASAMMAKHLSKLDRPEQVNAYLNKLFSPAGVKLLDRRENFYVMNGVLRAEEFAYQAYVDSLLSRVVTHARNVVDTGANMFYQDIKQLASSVPALARLDGTQALRNLQEGLARMHGHLESLGDVMTMYAKNAPKRAFNMDDFSNLHEVAMMRSTGSLSPMALRQASLLKRMGHWLESKRPTAALGKTDSALKYIDSRGTHRAAAFNKAASLTDNPRLRKKLYDSFVDSPTEQMKTSIYVQAEKNTYQQIWNPQSMLERNVLSQINSIPFLRFFAPFVRTPYQIMKRGLLDGPTTILAPQTLKGLAAGGAQFDKAAAKVLLATGGTAYLITHTSEEILTGSVPYQLQGEIPEYTIKLPGQKEGLRYGSLGPVRWILGSAANLRNLYQYTDWDSLDGPETAEKAFTGVTLALAEALSDSFFLERLVNISAGVRDYETSGWDIMVRELQNTAMGLMAPGATRQIKDFYDGKARQTETFMEKFYAQTPGLSKDLPAVPDLFGNVLKKPSMSLVLPVYLSDMDFSPEMMAIRRYGVDVPDVARDFKGYFKFTARQRADMKIYRAYGNGTQYFPPMREGIARTMRTNYYLQALPEEKKKILQETISSWNDMALAELTKNDPSVMEQFNEALDMENERRAIQGETP